MLDGSGDARRRGIALVVGVAAALTPVAGAAGDAPEGSGGAPFVEGQAIIEVEDGFTIEEIHAAYGTSTIAVVEAGSRPDYLIDLPDGLGAEEFLVLAEADVRIKDQELNFELGDPVPGTGSFFFASVSPAYTNPTFGGLIDLYRPGVLGGAPAGPSEPVVVAIVDTGVDVAHPALSGAIEPGGISFVPGQPAFDDPAVGDDSDGDGLVDEVRGHGTMIAGLVLAVAPESTILPIRVMDADGRSTTYQVAQGISEAVARGASVVVVSLGTTVVSEVIEDVIAAGAELGVVVVTAAGNDAGETVWYPSTDPFAIAVAGVDDGGVATAFTNFGSHVDLSAPALDLVSTFPEGGYARASGTSFGAGLVAGLAARVRGYDPSLSPEGVRMLLMSEATPFDGRNPDLEGVLGAGVIDVGAALVGVGGAAPRVLGDLDWSGIVDSDDLGMLLGGFGGAGAVGDLDFDGDVDSDDLGILLGGFGGG
ncbi:MAG: S8 family serine peptidase [Phycisphaerales bacterium]